MNRKNKGITLVALVITIIILLILAGISISSLTGSGLFQKAKDAKKVSLMKKAEEEIYLVIDEWRVESVIGNMTIEEFLDSKIESDEIDDYKKLEDGTIAIFRDGYYVIVDVDMNVKQDIEKFRYKTEATYEVISTDGTIYNILITITNNGGIQKVTCPNGKVVSGNDGISVEVEYDVENNKQYEFKVETQGDVDSVILDTNFLNVIEIEEDLVDGLYPVLYDTGVKIAEKTITINYPESAVKKYYSLDEGATWNEYTGKILINSSVKIKAKYTEDNMITQIVAKDIIYKMAENALPFSAYDGKYDVYTYLGGAVHKILLVDPSAWGKTIKVYGYKIVSSNQYEHYVNLCNASYTSLASIDLEWWNASNTGNLPKPPNTCTTFRSIVIPNNTAHIDIGQQGLAGAIYEVTY